MSTILDQENIQKAKTAVNTYRDTCKQLHQQLTSIIDGLRAASFIGDASNGFDTFYSQVTPALSTNLYGEDNSVTAMLIQLLDAVEKALLRTVDPDLGKANSNAANDAENVIPDAAQ